MTRSVVIYLISYALSLLGNGVIAVVYPLLILQITGSPAAAGTVALATMLPSVVVGLFGGVLVDRFNRRNISVFSDFVSAASVAALPLVDSLVGLNLGWFILLGVVGAIGDLPGMTAREALLPALLKRSSVDTDRIVGLREAIGGVMIFIGPAAAGTLMLLLPGPTVLLVTASTSLLAALTTFAIPAEAGLDGAAEGKGSLTPRAVWLETLEGFSLVFRKSRFILTITAMGVITGSVVASMQALILPVHFTNIGMEASLGFVLAALSLGSVVGSVVYAAISKPGSRRKWFVSSSVLMAATVVVILSLPPAWALITGAAAAGLVSGPFNAIMGVLMIERIPEKLRGRVMSSQNALMTMVPPLFIFAAGIAVELGSLRATSLALAAFWIIGAIWWLREKSFYDLEPPGKSDPDQTNRSGASVIETQPVIDDLRTRVSTDGEHYTRDQMNER